MYKKILSKLFSGIVCLTLVIPMVSGVKTPTVAEAAGPTVHHAKGWAFSDMPDQSEAAIGVGCARENIVRFNCAQGLGWISMASSNANSGGGSYEVTLDPVTGKFGGYAWSEMGGWVDFAPSATPPQNSHTVARSAFVDPACLADKTKTCDIKGWIRFVNGGIGQWDGWVSMDARNPTLVTGGTDDTAYSVKLLPEINGIRKFSGFAYGDLVVGWVDFGKAQLELTDVCPDTKFVVPTDPKKTGIDPKTAGVQTTMPVGYSLSPDGTMCGIFGCTDKDAYNYVKTATIDDGSCIPREYCPDGSVPPKGDLSQCPKAVLCPDGTPAPKGDLDECPKDILCPDGSAVPPGGICPGAEDQCRNVEGFQATVDAPYTQVIQSGVKNCYIVGCMDPHANNQTPGATMQDNPSTCTYDPNVEICGNKTDDDGDGLIDEGCPSYPTAPKKPIYIET